jgi:hypothetical protein
MLKGDFINTPRFLKVKIEDILTADEAQNQGFTEPTHYINDPEFYIFGKSIGINRMIFAAVRRQQ